MKTLAEMYSEQLIDILRRNPRMPLRDAQRIEQTWQDLQSDHLTDAQVEAAMSVVESLSNWVHYTHVSSDSEELFVSLADCDSDSPSSLPNELIFEPVPLEASHRSRGPSVLSELLESVRESARSMEVGVQAHFDDLETGATVRAASVPVSLFRQRQSVPPVPTRPRFSPISCTSPDERKCAVRISEVSEAIQTLTGLPNARENPLEYAISVLRRYYLKRPVCKFKLFSESVRALRQVLDQASSYTTVDALLTAVVQTRDTAFQSDSHLQAVLYVIAAKTEVAIDLIDAEAQSTQAKNWRFSPIMASP